MMKFTTAVAAIALFAGSLGVFAQQAPAQQDERQTMMATMKANNAQLDQLVTKMNAAQGAEKTDAMAAVLTALVKQHQMMGENMMMKMMDMSGMMEKMRGNSTGTTGTAATPAK